MRRISNFAVLLAAGAVTVLVVAGLSPAAGSAGPSNSSPPTISGSAVQGSTLTAHSGTWNGSNLTYAWQWRRCDRNGGSCSAISGATSRTYTLKGVDVGNTLRVRQKASNSDGSSASTSVPTAVVRKKPAAPPTSVDGCPPGSGPVEVSALSPPARLLIDGQQVTPPTVTPSAADLTFRFHISACNGRPVVGALVYEAAVPYNQYSVPPEAVTGQDGWATLTSHQQGGFPASSRQQLLAVFVRARKPGDNLLGGISTRRLVSFPVRLS